MAYESYYLDHACNIVHSMCSAFEIYSYSIICYPESNFAAIFRASATTSTGTNTNTPTINSPASTTTTPLGGSPYVTTPGNGALGGVGSGLGPSGVGINTDDSHAGLTLQQNSSIFWLFVATMLGFLWG